MSEATSMRQFEITLKNEKVKLYNRIGWIILFIHLTVFLYLGLFLTDKQQANRYLFTLAAIGGCFLLRFYLQQKKTKWQINVDVFFALLAIGLVTNQQYLASLIPGVFYILSPFTARKFIVSFTEQRIVYPSFPARTIRWNSLSNAMLKDGLLTLDSRNNKLIQQPIDETLTSVNEQEFNDFCRQQLNK